MRCSARVFSFRCRLGLKRSTAWISPIVPAGDKIFEFDLWASPMQTAREQLHLWHVGEDQFFANGCGDHGEIPSDSKWRPPIWRALGRLGFGLIEARWTQPSDALYADLGDRFLRAIFGDVLASLDLTDDLDRGALGKRGCVFSRPAERDAFMPSSLRFALSSLTVFPGALGREREGRLERASVRAEQAQAAGATLVSKEELLSRCDAVSIHLVLSPRSRGLIGAADIPRMKAAAILINPSRGAIVDQAGLLEALQSAPIT